MTNFLMFLQWQWRRFDLVEKVLFFALALIVVSIAFPDPYKEYIWVSGVAINLAVALKWFVWDRISESYTKYKKQRDGLFNEIRGE